ncbi:MAG: DegT/DnrJ/EryC1/StrS family aminotransferase [Thermodesulfobacteriota bacterium]
MNTTRNTRAITGIRETVPFLDLKREYQSIKDEINRAVLRTLESGSYILGREVDGFEKAFARWLGLEQAVAVASGTDALMLALVAAGIQAGDRVITVPMTAVPTVSAIRCLRAEPVFVDIDPETYTMSPESLKKELENPSGSRRAKAVVPVHLYGQPADMDPIMELAALHGLVVVEDTAQALGAKYKGCPVGTIGHFGCFSFYPTKNLGACGDSGMVIVRNPEDARRLRMLRCYGEQAKNNNVIEGFNSRMDEIQAAILRTKLGRLEDWNAARREKASRYSGLLANTDLSLPKERAQCDHAYHLYVVRHPERDRLMETLAALGVQTAVHYPVPVHLQPAFSYLGYGSGSFPEAERCAKEVLSLPLSPFTRREEIERVVEAVNTCVVQFRQVIAMRAHA